jgi:hypothetical protein
VGGGTFFDQENREQTKSRTNRIAIIFLFLLFWVVGCLAAPPGQTRDSDQWLPFLWLLLFCTYMASFGSVYS